MARSGDRAGSAADDFLVWYGFQSHCLLEESIEREVTSFRSAAIEAERELVQIAIKLGGTICSMVNTQPPPIKEACFPMNLRHENVGWVAAGGNLFRLWFEADSREAVVGRPAIGSNRCSRAHSCLDERKLASVEAAPTAEDPAEYVTDEVYHSRSVLKALDDALDDGPKRAGSLSPSRIVFFARWHGDDSARRAVTNNRAPLLLGVSRIFRTFDQATASPRYASPWGGTRSMAPFSAGC